MKKNRNNFKQDRSLDNRGFTMIELLLVMLIMGILAAIIFTSIGNQRQKTKLNAVLQTAKGTHAIARECYFRLGHVNNPDDAQNPTNEICQYSKTQWFPITVSECVYGNVGAGNNTASYEIICSDFGKKIECGIQSNGECEVSNIP